MANCHRLFTLEDIKTCLPLSSKNHALRIPEVLNEVLNDIAECTLTDPVNNCGDKCLFAGLDELCVPNK